MKIDSYIDRMHLGTWGSQKLAETLHVEGYDTTYQNTFSSASLETIQSAKKNSFAKYVSDIDCHNYINFPNYALLLWIRLESTGCYWTSFSSQELFWDWT